MAWRSFGALRVAMIGVHQDRQRRGHGSHLLKYVEGLAATISELVSVRYLVADANPERHDWYLARGWQDNNSEAERKRTGNAISMRFDLHAPRT
ncbi:MAG: GNAT family N-acetyltransferase [Solirubrobacteraceae bacterium]